MKKFYDVNTVLAIGVIVYNVGLIVAAVFLMVHFGSLWPMVILLFGASLTHTDDKKGDDMNRVIEEDSLEQQEKTLAEFRAASGMEAEINNIPGEEKGAGK